MSLKSYSYSVLKLPVLNTVLGWVFKLLYSAGILKKFIFPFSGNLKIGLNDAKFLMYSDGSDSVAAKLYMQDYIAFEPEVFAVFEEIAPRVKSFLDVGANTGAYTLYVKALNPKCKIWSFEPVPFIYDRLVHNKGLNKFEGIECKRLGLGDKNGQLDFFVPKSIRIPTGGSLTENYRPDSDKISVEVMRLDDFITSENMTSVDFIKIDTESTEPAVIGGGLECVRKHRPYLLVEVLQPKEGRLLEELLNGLNYQYFQILPRGLRPVKTLEHGEWPQHWNFLFVPDEKVKDLKSWRKLEIL